jgi:putative heme-binding domain-containing protein
VRAQAINVLSRLTPRAAAGTLRGLLSDSERPVADTALQALIDVQDAPTIREILCGSKFSEEVRRRTAERLVDTTGGALVLLRLVDENKLPDALKQLVIDRARAHADSNVRVLYEKFVPEDQRPKKLGQAIADDDILALVGDASRGRNIFAKSSAAQCNSCHAVQGFGGQAGPELTHIGKKYERRALLETIIEPSKAIAPEYVPYVLETKDGQVYAGFIVERNDKVIVLKDVKGRQIRVAADEIEALVEQPKSLMPELVLSEITAQDAADLLAFLMTLK